MNSNFNKKFNSSTLFNSSIRKCNINKLPNLKRINSPKLFNSKQIKNIKSKITLNKDNYQETILSYNDTTCDEENILKKRLNKSRNINYPEIFKNKNISNTKLKIGKNKRKKTISFSKREINLLNNPDSYFYQLFQSAREAKKKQLINISNKKVIHKLWLSEVKNTIKKNEENAFKELDLLQKKFNEDDEDKIKGKIISTRTFLDLKIDKKY